MGSVVKSIGKVFKKIGRAIKKAAPLILVAAAAYVGYGYATGFTGGGWPRITQWGKSLMSGIRGGNTISQAASQASQSFGQVASNVAPTSVPMDPGMGPGGASEFASQGLLGASQPGFLERAGTAVLDTLVPPASAMPSDVALTGQATTDVATDVATNNLASTPNMRTFTSTGFSDIRTLPNQTLFNKGNMVTEASNTWKDIVGLAGSKVKEAAAWYKDLWANDPLVAMYGTQKIAEMMLTFLDDSAEKEAEAKAAVAGFPRRSFSDVMKSNRAARRRGASHTGGLLA